MNKTPTSEEILSKTADFLTSQGVGSLEQSQSPGEKLAQIMEALSKARNTQSALYGWEPAGGGFVRKVKNMFQLKMKNIILNTLEKYVARQQKFNEVAYQAIVALQAENQALKEKIADISHAD